MTNYHHHGEVNDDSIMHPNAITVLHKMFKHMVATPFIDRFHRMICDKKLARVLKTHTFGILKMYAMY